MSFELIALGVGCLGVGFGAGVLLCYFSGVRPLTQKIIDMKKLGWHDASHIDENTPGPDPTRETREFF